MATNHEYTFNILRPEHIQVKLHSPWLGELTRLARAKSIITNEKYTDQQKMELLMELFSPYCYQFDVIKVGEDSGN